MTSVNIIWLWKENMSLAPSFPGCRNLQRARSTTLYATKVTLLMEGCEHVAGGKGVRVLTCGCFQKPNSFSPHPPEHTPRAQMDAAACGVRTFSPARTARARRAPPCGVRTFSPAFWSVPIHTGAADAWRFSLTSWAAVIHCMAKGSALLQSPRGRQWSPKEPGPVR